MNVRSGVVSIGHSPAFYVVFVPLEYIPSIPSHSTYVIVIRTFRVWVTIYLNLQGDDVNKSWLRIAT